MRTLLVAAALVAASAGVASADPIRPCEPLEVSCHMTCTLPSFENKQIVWAQC